jgi:amino acid transporter
MQELSLTKSTEGSAPELTGYRQELKRTLGQGQIFAISFAFISVAVGIFGTYDDVLQTAGPVGIWLWIITAIGQTLVALVIAQFAARIALTGSSYQWASRLANPRIGWGFGWISFCYFGISVVTIDNALASQALMPLLGMASDEGTARVITLVILLIQTVLAIASTRIVGILNALAVGVEISIVSVLVIALMIAFATTGLGSASNLASRGITAGETNYFGIGGGLMLAMLMGLTTLTGFDAAANLAEEAKDPYRNVPRAIVGSVIAAGVLGLLFLIALTVAIPNIGQISRSGEAVAQILNEQLGSLVERMLLVAITFAFFACGMVVLATGSRLIYAMSRDGRFPFHRMMRQVNTRTQTPIPATLLIFASGIVLMIAMPGKALLALITASTIIPVLIYAATVVLYLAVRRKLGRKEGAFDLGRFELPIAISALVWLVAATFVLVTPRAALIPVFIVVGLVVIGGLYFVGMLIFDRKSLESEPEAMAISMH